MVTDGYATKLQLDLDNAFKWTQNWLLFFKTSKCVVMHYGHSNKKFSYFIDGRQLGQLMLGRIKKSFGHFDLKLFRSLYFNFIRPFLEFAVPGSMAGSASK
jgi:hypothetical protein